MTTRGRGLTAAASVAAVLTVTLPAHALDRSPLDAEEVAALRAQHPKAGDLLEAGEARALAGAFAQADALFKQGETEAPDGSILWRRDCQMLVALGRRDEALHACSVATETRRSATNLRATLSALVSGPEPPRNLDLFAALTLEEGRRRSAGAHDPLLAAADCDLAESVGDGTMLQECATELNTLAPNAPDTKRAMALLEERCPPWRFWTGWSLFAAAGAATAWHASATRRGRRGLARAAVAATIAVAAFGGGTGIARAQEVSAISATKDVPAIPHGQMSKWPVKDDDPASAIPSEAERNADPLQFGYWIQDLIAKANLASKKGDHAQAAKLWEALAIAVPDRSVAFARACDEYEAMHEPDKAIDACGRALLRDGLTVADYTHFIRVVVDKPGPLSAKETAALAQVLDHMKADDASKALVPDLECQVGVRTSNEAQLKECTAALEATAPDDAKTISYEWALAIVQDRFGEARTLVERAKAKGVDGEGLEGMERTTRDSSDRYWKRVGAWTLAGVLALAALAFVARSLSSRRRTLQPA